MDIYRRAVHAAHQYRTNRETAYQSMLGEVATKIDRVAGRRCSTVYKVPRSVTGSITPYNVTEARDWLMAKLRAQGFKTRPLLQDTLWVYWGDDYERIRRADAERGSTSLDEAVRLIDETLR